MNAASPDTDELLKRVQCGDEGAGQALLMRHAGRLKQMVALRQDRRLLSRFDPSDVVQEALLEAHAKLQDYARHQPVAFYPWIRAIAWQRLLKFQRRHLHSKKRTVRREEPNALALSDESALALVNRLAATGSTPSDHLVLDELRRRVRESLARMSPADRELLVLRYLEQMPLKEIAEVLEITEGAVKTRHVRALERLHDWLNLDSGEEKS